MVTFFKPHLTAQGIREWCEIVECFLGFIAKTMITIKLEIISIGLQPNCVLELGNQSLCNLYET